ncbi:MAG: PepSY-associated TM helix domain-containing protein, partial [Acinetobacter sp.]
KGQRSWLDAHNATAVFALPFHLMITFSGLLLLMFMFMPWGINQAYENRQQFLRDQQASMIEQPQKAEDVPREGERAARGERGQQRGEHAQGRGEERPPQPELRPAPLTELAPIMVAVEQQWKDNPIASINIISPNTDQAKIELRALRAESVAHRNVYATLNYNGVTGQDETDKTIRIKNPSIPSGIYNVVTVLHEARGLDLALRWLLFCSGILGTLMVATGLILWCVKRAPQQQK